MGNHRRKKTTVSTKDLLEDLRIERESNPDELLPHALKPASRTHSRIPTLKPGVYRDASPMIAARFRFAGTWKNAWPGQTWLGIDEIKAAGKNRKILKQLKTRAEYWDGCVSQLHEPYELTLFGIDLEEMAETYLVWGLKPEPTIHIYESQHSVHFKDFNAMLLWLLDRRS